MTVMWSTFRQTETSMVEYGLSPDQLDSVANGTWQMLNNRGTHQYVHTVKLRGLLIDTQYHYRCGDGLHFSEVFSFRTLRKGTEWRPRVLIFGDLGFKDGASTPCSSRRPATEASTSSCTTVILPMIFIR
ncbi:hypothetical protein CEXT_166361, partial [Caerostris extrusa]